MGDAERTGVTMLAPGQDYLAVLAGVSAERPAVSFYDMGKQMPPLVHGERPVRAAR